MQGLADENVKFRLVIVDSQWGVSKEGMTGSDQVMKVILAAAFWIDWREESQGGHEGQGVEQGPGGSLGQRDRIEGSDFQYVVESKVAICDESLDVCREGRVKEERARR